jgi:hypothetical protein
MSTDDFQITSPCPLALSELSGDGPKRHCDQCDRTVHDLSTMTHRQASRLRQRARRRGDRLCGILHTDHSGRPRFQPSLLQKLSQKMRAAPALAILLQPSGCPSPEPPPPPIEEAQEVQAVQSDEELELELLQELRTNGYIE